MFSICETLSSNTLSLVLSQAQLPPILQRLATVFERSRVLPGHDTCGLARQVGPKLTRYLIYTSDDSMHAITIRPPTPLPPNRSASKFEERRISPEAVDQ